MLSMKQKGCNQWSACESFSPSFSPLRLQVSRCGSNKRNERWSLVDDRRLRMRLRKFRQFVNTGSCCLIDFSLRVPTDLNNDYNRLLFYFVERCDPRKIRSGACVCICYICNTIVRFEPEPPPVGFSSFRIQQTYRGQATSTEFKCAPASCYSNT
jgi:hypothetical protein